MVNNVGPGTYVTGQAFDYRIHCRAKFGQYCHAHDDPKAKNRVDVPRTIGAIVLRSKKNLNSFYNLP